MKTYFLNLLWISGLFIVSVFSESDAKIAYYHTDHLGSVRMVTDAQRNILRTLDYLPFGEDVAATENNQIKFTGQYRDGDTADDYFGARYYASRFGRFMSPDLIFADNHPDRPQSWNLYSYARNNPLRYKDPDGRATIADDAKRIIQTLDNNLAVVYDQGTTQAAFAEAQGATVLKPTGAPGNHIDKLTTAVEGTIKRTGQLKRLQDKTDYASIPAAVKKAVDAAINRGAGGIEEGTKSLNLIKRLGANPVNPALKGVVFTPGALGQWLARGGKLLGYAGIVLGVWHGVQVYSQTGSICGAAVCGATGATPDELKHPEPGYLEVYMRLQIQAQQEARKNGGIH